MNKFLLKVIKFSIFCSICFLLSYFLNIYFFEFDRFSSSKKTFIVGDSHAMCSLNPSIIENSVNLGSKGETLNITYHKLQYLNKINNINTLVISLSYHSISHNFLEERILNKSNLQKVVDNYYPFLNSNIIKELNVDFKKYYTGMANNILLPRFMYINNYFQLPEMKNYPYLDGFKYSTSMNLDKKKLESKLQGHFGENIFTISSVAVKYIYKLVEFSKKNQINLIFINTPVHNKYYERIPKELKEQYTEIQTKIKKEPNIYFLDYSNLNLEDSFYLDFDHTNNKGAKLVSEKLNFFLKNIK